MLRLLRPNISEHPSDEQLLADYVQHNNARALGILYERYMPMVYGVCVKITKDPALAEDAVMAIYETLVKKVKEHTIESFRGWLYVLARNHCLMEWRKAQRRPTDHHAPEDMVRYDAVEPVFEYELPVKNTPLERCLAELSDVQKACVTWFYYEDKSYKEIADLMLEELGKVRSHIQNGKRNLKNCLERLP